MKALTATQHAVLLFAHGDTLEGAVGNGAMYAPHRFVSAPTLRALAAAGYVDLQQQQHVVHTRPQWGRGRATRHEVSLLARVTAAGEAYAEQHGGIIKGHCDVPGCEDRVRVPQARCAYHVNKGADA